MNKKTGNIWEYIDWVSAICITTNGFIKHNDTAVMGAGIAKQAKEKYPGIDKNLAHHVKENGNIPGIIWNNPIIVSFPVKPISLTILDKEQVVPHMRSKIRLGSKAPGWACMADINLIEKSAFLLKKLAEKHKWKLVALTKPGCHNGGLNWEEVEPILDKYLDTEWTQFPQFIIIDRK